jgi:hypothetical protein
MALLVDSNNFATAAWMPYQPNPTFSVNFDGREGWHEVWVGLSEETEHSWKASWDATRFKLDFTPPLLVITNPASLTVMQPMIQVQGYCPEDLDSLYFDLSNADGVVSNEQAFVLDRYHDEETWEYTTTWFQAFDVALANGPNTFTFHATDLAGNVATTNFTFTLDYSDKTNPPLVRLFYPQDGTQLSGDDPFTWRGWVEDFTAKVTAEVLDASGTTNVYRGVVERDGKFWIENLPAATGTNWLRLKAQDVVGNASVTNIAVIRSSVLLTVNPPPVLAGQTLAIVTGTINSSDYTVWVNGVKAFMNGDGTWVASNTPVNAGGTAVFQARAIPNWDNGGNGTPAVEAGDGP